VGERSIFVAASVAIMRRRGMLKIMDLVGILARIDLRLAALGMSDNAAQIAARTPGAISNLRAAVRQIEQDGGEGKKGRRRGISTATAAALARFLKCRQDWLLTGDGEMDLAARITADQNAQRGGRG
jgi:hypothetical protein